jgi:FlaA1/EpsC-like NDP-sugar epimerase
MIRTSLASIIIFFPAFLYVTYLGNKDLIANPEKKDMWIRRWSIFLTLFIAGLTIAIDLTTLIYRFLGAEDLTLRFFLKIFFVLAVAISVFRFIWLDYKRTSFAVTKGAKISNVIVGTIILAAIILGVVIIGTPSAQRAKMMDDQRVNDLTSIQGQIVYSQWQNKGTVPATLDELKDPISGFVIPTDPETKQSYEYTMLSKNSFELCATFKTIASTTNENTAVARPVSYPYQNGTINENWQHGIGITCFTRTIDEKLYPINPKKY